MHLHYQKQYLHLTPVTDTTTNEKASACPDNEVIEDPVTDASALACVIKFPV
jgi:hypothetical protein